VLTCAAFSFVGLSVAFAQQQTDKPGTLIKAQDNKAKVVKQELAVIETDSGKIVFKFYEKEAPQHVANFKKLAREGYYNGCTFHRVIPDFMIQGGDSLSKDDDRSNDGTGGPGYTIPAEIKIKHTRGAVAAARLGDQVNPEKRSSGSQFFICIKDLPHLDQGGYTVFGQVIEGMDVVDKIVKVERDKKDNPIKKVVMKKVYIMTK
jgi:cyclophilin family peptidyl-prolyl cis-trans isomerase